LREHWPEPQEWDDVLRQALGNLNNSNSD
jgi:hypothetical protein